MILLVIFFFLGSFSMPSFLKSFQKFFTAGVSTSRVGFQLLGHFYQNFTTSQVLLQMNF